MNKIADVWMTTPRPRIEIDDRIRSPVILPRDEAMTLFMPEETLLVIASNTAGPGLQMVMNAARENINQVSSVIVFNFP